MTEECGKREEQDLKQILCRQAQFNWLHDGWADGKSDVNVEKLKLFLKCANPRSFVLVPCSAFTSFFVILNLPPFSLLFHSSSSRWFTNHVVGQGLWKLLKNCEKKRIIRALVARLHETASRSSKKDSFMSSTMLTRNFFCKRHHSQTSTTHQTTKMEDSITLHIARCAALWVK